VELTNDVDQVAKSITTMQDQLDSLASVVLQNHRVLDLFTAENRGLCLFLNEECCFYVNQSGTVRDMVQQLQDQVAHRRQELTCSWNRWSNIWNWASWLIPLSGPIFMLLLTMIFGPCILNAITHFISSQMEEIKLQPLTRILWNFYSLVLMLVHKWEKHQEGGNEEEDSLQTRP
jgi:hypothetical protein